MFFDFHTHAGVDREDVKTIRNAIIPDGTSAERGVLAETDNHHWVSAGIHPWYINEENYSAQLDLLREVAVNDQVKLIGECGLDRLRGPNLNLQMLIFTEQINLSEELKKPVLVHCVRCFSELLHLNKISRPTVPLIVHGFNNKREIARQLIDGGFYLSFGAALLNNKSNAVKIFREIPAERIFLETDDKDVAIECIYEEAATLKNVSVNALKESIFANCLSLGIIEK